MEDREENMLILRLKGLYHLCCIITTMKQLNCSEKDQYFVYTTYTNVCKHCLITTVEYLLTVTSLTRRNTEFPSVGTGKIPIIVFPISL